MARATPWRSASGAALFTHTPWAGAPCEGIVQLTPGAPTTSTAWADSPAQPLAQTGSHTVNDPAADPDNFFTPHPAAAQFLFADGSVRGVATGIDVTILQALSTRAGGEVAPDVALHFRGDCGFGVPAMYEVCERLNVTYTFGLSTNAVLQRETEGLLAEAVAAYERERQTARQQDPPRSPVPSRLFTGFWYQAGTWPQPRWVVAKAEANDRGTNRRFVVSNRPGAVVLPGAIYKEYAGRGESENRNKDFKCDLAMDRLSDHRFVANYFRL
jgi:prepilin-type processing-associated H-X9-DG protein